MRKFLVIIFIISVTSSYSQSRKELASFFETYLNSQSKNKTSQGSFEYNEAMNYIHVTKSIISFNNDGKTEITSDYKIDLNNIRNITESIGISEFEGTNLYTYVLVIDTKKIFFDTRKITTNDSNVEYRIDKVDIMYLSPSSMFVSESDIALLKRFTRSFFKGIPLIEKNN